MSGDLHRKSALEMCENLLCPGKKWKISPYLEKIISFSDSHETVYTVPFYQSVILDVIRAGCLPSHISILDLSPSVLPEIIILDAILAWETACSVYNIPSGIENIYLNLSYKTQNNSKELLEIFRKSIVERAEKLPDFKALYRIAKSIENSSSFKENPNILFAPFPWEYKEGLDDVLYKVSADGIFAGLSWQKPDIKPDNLFSWRYNFLKKHNDFVILGPCGQEYERDLPEVCCQCFHGRKEPVHNYRDHKVSWNYVVFIKRSGVIDKPGHSFIKKEDLSQVIQKEINLRYIGIFRERDINTTHPDDVCDNPCDTKWKEYIKVCPGHSRASKIAIERCAGMQIPELTYGQWLHLQNLQIKRPYVNSPDVYNIKVRNEASFHRPDKLDIQETFLENYTDEISNAVDEAAYRLFGFSHMHSFQHTILKRVLCGYSIFAIAATGGGKSECFILPAIILPGITVVVSPLRSLIQDQYEQRISSRYGIDHLTTYINGEVNFYERQGRLRRMVLGHFKLIYITPEQLERGYVLEALAQAEKSVGIRYLAMDEAHCISQWGHDFRPSYLNIVHRLNNYNLRPCRIALTATASPLVRDDICAELKLNSASLGNGGDVFIDSSNRPELNLVAYRLSNTEEKASFIVDALKKLKGQEASIVFMPYTGGTVDAPSDMGVPVSNSDIKNTGMVSPGVTPFAHYIENQLNQPVAMYHGAMNSEKITEEDKDDLDNGLTRQKEQRSFINDEKSIMIATKGFGMGIDKPDIRLVIHRSPPGNLEAYAQEAGRAGRDGKPATVILLFSNDRPEIKNPEPDKYYLSRTRLPSDQDIQEFFINQRYVRSQDIEAMINFLNSAVPQKVNNNLYFTSDQLIEILDKACYESKVLNLDRPYKWPNFEDRKKSGAYESSDHAKILDRGHIYKHKCKHINKIMAVLFNNRPVIGDNILPVINFVHSTGILMYEFTLYNPEGIISSSTYFGEIFRTAGVDAMELKKLLPDNKRTDIIPLARRLNLSIFETASMLKDIRYCEGKTDKWGRWAGSLLNFRRIEHPRYVKFPNPYEAETWRNYGGAYKRSLPSGSSKTLNDYFPDKVLIKPEGWEVSPASGLEYPDKKVYLEAFMKLHNQRHENDKNNFSYLINHYAGNSSKECLRSILLGYLKTSEVVLGGKCYGCSVCVPDLNFEKYSLSERMERVVRLFENTVNLAKEIEGINRDNPGTDILDKLISAIEYENSHDRSGTSYLDSWLARLIQDDPQHQGALWMRLRALEKGILLFSPEELLLIIERLVEIINKQADLTQLAYYIKLYENDLTYKKIRLILKLCSAKIAKLQGDTEKEVGLLKEFIELSGQNKKIKSEYLFYVYERLLSIFREDGPLANERLAASFGLTLARLPDVTMKLAREGYEEAVKLWEWSDLKKELSSPGYPHPEAALMGWFVINHNKNYHDMLNWLEKNGKIVEKWPLEALQTIEYHFAKDLNNYPGLLLILGDHFMNIPDKMSSSYLYLILAGIKGAKLLSKHLKYLGTNITDVNPDNFRNLIGDQKDLSRLIYDMMEHTGKKNFPEEWLPYFPEKILIKLPSEIFSDLIENGLSKNLPVKKELMSIIMAGLNQSDTPWDISVINKIEKNPKLALQFLESSIKEKNVNQKIIEILFPALFKDNISQGTIVTISNELCKYKDLLQENNLAFQYIDNWEVIKLNKAIWADLFVERIDPHTLISITKNWLKEVDKPHRIDMIIVILKYVIEVSSSTWLTPVSLLLQALCTAGRFPEAKVLLKSYSNMEFYIKETGEKGQDYLERMEKSVKLRKCFYEGQFRKLWQFVTVAYR